MVWSCSAHLLQSPPAHARTPASQPSVYSSTYIVQQNYLLICQSTHSPTQDTEYQGDTWDVRLLMPLFGVSIWHESAAPCRARLGRPDELDPARASLC